MAVDLINVDVAESLFKTLPPLLRPPSMSPKMVTLNSVDGAVAPAVHIRVSDSQGWIVKTVWEREIENTELKDWTAPYNYGSVFMTGAAEPARLESLKPFAQERNVIAEFLRFHPLTQAWKVNENEVSSNRLTITMPLMANQDPVDGFNSSARGSFRKAAKSGVVVRRQDPSSMEFSTRYRTAMQSKMARTGLFFSTGYLRALARFPSVRIYEARLSGRVLASALILVSDQIAEYHLAESDAEGRRLGAMNYLMGEIARDLSSDGLTKFHIGGGLTGGESDSLFKFKLSLGGSTSAFRVGGAVYDARYSELETKVPTRFLHYRTLDDPL